MPNLTLQLAQALTNLVESMQEAHDVHIYGNDDNHPDDCGYCAQVAFAKALLAQVELQRERSAMTVLRALVNDLDAMQRDDPMQDYFGPFSMSTDDEDGVSVEWPNVSIDMQMAHALLGDK